MAHDYNCREIDDLDDHLEGVDTDEALVFFIWEACCGHNVCRISQVPPKCQIDAPTAAAPLARVACCHPCRGAGDKAANVGFEHKAVVEEELTNKAEFFLERRRHTILAFT